MGNGEDVKDWFVELTTQLWFLAVIVCLVGNTIDATGWVLEKKSHLAREAKNALIEEESEKDKSWVSSKLWWAGFGMHSFGNIIAAMSYGFGPQSLLLPLENATPVFTTYLSHKFLNEDLRRQDIFATITIIVAGGLSVLFGPRSEGEEHSAKEFVELYANPNFILFMVVITVLIVIVYILIKYAQFITEKYGQTIDEHSHTHSGVKLGANNNDNENTSNHHPQISSNNISNIDNATYLEEIASNSSAQLTQSNVGSSSDDPRVSVIDIKDPSNDVGNSSKKKGRTSVIPLHLSNHGHKRTMSIPDKIKVFQKLITMRNYQGNWSFVYSHTFLMTAYISIASYFGVVNILLTKSVMEILASTAINNKVAVENWTHWITYVLVICLISTSVSLEYWRQKALEAYNSVYVGSIYQTTVIIFGIICGAIFFDEFHNLPVINISIFILCITVSFFGIALLAYQRELKLCKKVFPCKKCDRINDKNVAKRKLIELEIQRKMQENMENDITATPHNHTELDVEMHELDIDNVDMDIITEIDDDHDNDGDDVDDVGDDDDGDDNDDNESSAVSGSPPSLNDNDNLK